MNKKHIKHVVRQAFPSDSVLPNAGSIVMKQAGFIAVMLFTLTMMPLSASGQEMRTSRVVETLTTAEYFDLLSVSEERLLALADEFPEDLYDWRPADGVRSSAEVFMHVAMTNFMFPIMAGYEAPASTGMTLDNLPTAAPAYENSLKRKDQIRPEIKASFGNLRSAIEASSESDLERQVTVFGNTLTIRVLWLAQINHIHEHLGQLIAYSRMNGVVPPWNQ